MRMQVLERASPSKIKMVDGQPARRTASDVFLHLQDGQAATTLSLALSASGDRVRALDDVEILQKEGDHGRALILDRYVAGEDMLHVVETLRGRGIRLPIIVLTNVATAQECIAALQAGADECLGKPVDVEELLLRLASLYDRYRRETAAGIVVAHLRLDLVNRKVSRNGSEVDLLTKEFQVLKVLMENVEKTVSRSHLLSTVWEDRMRGNTNVVDVTIGMLRRKLNVEGEPKVLHSVRGIGFMLGIRRD